MHIIGSILIAFIMMAVGPAFAASDLKPFAHFGVGKDAERYESYVVANWKPGTRKPAELRSAGDRALATDPRAASSSYAYAVTADPKSADGWLGLARALLAIKADPDKGSERYDLPVNASAAAYLAYQRATTPALKSKALAVLSEALVRRVMWRPAIDSLKSSLALVEDAKVREAYEKLRAEHGFRMTDYTTDSEASSPRVCIQFSETLSRANVDFAKFVSVDGKDPQAVVPEDSQLCVEGMTHGARYEIAVRAGLPSDVEESLEKPINIAVYVPDRKPFVRFSGKGYVLPTRGQQGIPVVSVNTSNVAIEVYRIGDRSLAQALGNGDFDRQLYGYELSNLRDRTGQRIYKGTMDVATRLNEEVTTAFPVTDSIGELKPGAYAMIASPGKAGAADEEGEDDGSYSNIATQWFIVSDMGLTAFTGDDGIHAFVRSLAETKAMPGSSVKLVARNNEILATTKTDGNGYARFDAGLVKGEGGMAPAVLVAENGEGEYAFLDLSSNAFDLSDRGVKGREPPGPIDAFLYTERGVYRPGEDVSFTALVRDAAGRAASLPVTLIVSRPDGVEHVRYTLADQGLGGRTIRLGLNHGAMTGTWRAKIHADPKDDALTQATFLVEDYVPERLDMTLDAGAGALTPDATKTVKLSGRYLYGPPAAGLGIEGEVVVKESDKAEGLYAGYAFGDASERISPVRQALEGLPTTGDDGTAQVPVVLPAVGRTARNLEASVILRLRESGGRTIERSVSIPVDLEETRIGVKPAFDGRNLDEGSKASFDVVVLDKSGKPADAKGLAWQLLRLETSWQWYMRDGSWQYESQTLKRKVADGTLDVTAAAPAHLETDVRYGRYRLEIAPAVKDELATSIEFNAGWYAGDETADSPEILDVGLDKASYEAGDTAKLRIASKTGGKALVSVLGSGLLDMQEVDVPKGGGEVSLKVADTWGPGAYATVLLYRPMEIEAKRMPSRALGTIWVGVDQKPRTLAVALATEAKIKSGSTLSIPVKLTGLAAGEEARVAVAAVDVGILNLTRYQAPAPESHFYAQRKLGVEIRDFYGRLIDGMRAERGKVRSGGDAMEETGLKGSPPVEETVAFHSGIVKVEADGTAKIEFALPDFNGTVRVMAVAWTKDKVGHGTSDVIVRDAVALTASAPRFLTLGDEVRFDMSLHNVDGPDGNYVFAVTREPAVEGPADGMREAVDLMNRDVALKNGERRSESLIVEPADVGLETYTVRVTGPNGVDVHRTLTFDVKPPAGDIRRMTVKELAANGGKLTLGKDLVSGLIRSRTTVSLSVGPTARMDVAGLLRQLDRYPYGCAEQTTSRAMPLLYVNAVAASIGIAPDKELKERVQKAIDRVFEMQDGSGAFGAWGPSNGDLWLTAYVTDFLTRAKEQSFEVRAVPFGLALDRLQNFIANAQDFDAGGEDRAYALYVLARNGRAPIGELRYYIDTRLDRFSTPLAKAQLGATAGMLGDKPRAEAAFRAALKDFDDAMKDQVTTARDDYGSTLRDGAALVALTSEANVAKTEAPRLVNVISKAYQARSYTSTQEQAWMLLAAKALGDEAKGTKLMLGETPVQGSILRSLSVEDLEKGVTVTNSGDVTTDAVVTVIGASLTPEPAISKGLAVERSFYKLDGTPVKLDSATGGTAELAQNERLVAVVKVLSDEEAGRVLLADRLPAGLEIENPRLVESGDVKSISWLDSALKPEHSEFRDDRFVAAFNLSSGASDGGSDSSDDESSDSSGSPDSTAGGQAGNAPGAASPESTVGGAPAKATATVAYVVRAVTPGKFVHPAATVEDMYRPERYARTGSGTLTVTPGK